MVGADTVKQSAQRFCRIQFPEFPGRWALGTGRGVVDVVGLKLIMSRQIIGRTYSPRLGSSSVNVALVNPSSTMTS
jgi:hypothetical protein